MPKFDPPTLTYVAYFMSSLLQLQFDFIVITVIYFAFAFDRDLGEEQINQNQVNHLLFIYYTWNHYCYCDLAN